MAGEIQGEEHGERNSAAAQPAGNLSGQVIDLLNQDLCRHLGAVMLSVNYFEVVDCNMDRNAAGQLATQMHKELQWRR